VQPQAAFALTDQGGGLQPVHVRHLHVHEDQVEVFAFGQIHCFAAVFHADHFVPLACHQQFHQAAVDLVVFCKKDAQLPFGRRRRRRRLQRRSGGTHGEGGRRFQHRLGAHAGLDLHGESGAMARSALHLDASPHELRKPG